MQLIGLGSAGTNIVEAFLKTKKTKDLISSDLTRLSLLAIDIADPEIRSLNETHEQFLKSMIKAGVPKERMRLIAESVKFPTAEAMFDFINQKYGEYVVSDGSKLDNYIPWLQSTMAVPPRLRCRKRCTASTLMLHHYSTVYYQKLYKFFKEQALSSIVTPTVVLVYGLGGGTEVAFSLTSSRHLRKVLGSGVPIIAL